MRLAATRSSRRASSVDIAGFPWRPQTLSRFAANPHLRHYDGRCHCPASRSRGKSMAVRSWRALAALICFVVSHVAIAADPRFPLATRHQIDTTVTRSFKDTRAPGAVVGIWMPDGVYVTAKG